MNYLITPQIDYILILYRVYDIYLFTMTRRHENLGLNLRQTKNIEASKSCSPISIRAHLFTNKLTITSCLLKSNMF